MINVFLINDSFHLVDLPGYGFAKVNKAEKKRWGEMMEAYFRESTLLRHALQLVDIRHEPTADDAAMAAFYRQCDIPFTVIATKADKISRGARMKHHRAHLPHHAKAALGSDSLFRAKINPGAMSFWNVLTPSWPDQSNIPNV